MKFNVGDLEPIRKPGVSIRDIRQKVDDTIEASSTLAASVRALDKATGNYEIVLTGTIDHKFLPTPPKAETASPKRVKNLGSSLRLTGNPGTRYGQ